MIWRCPWRHNGNAISRFLPMFQALRFASKADMCSAPAHVCYGPKADMRLFDEYIDTPQYVPGIVRPMALAVLRLMANSNFVGCSIGISFGCLPCSILCTNLAARSVPIGCSRGPRLNKHLRCLLVCRDEENDVRCLEAAGGYCAVLR